MKLIDSLYEIGFDFEVSGEKIRYKNSGRQEPPAHTKDLLQQIKTCKASAIEYIKRHTYLEAEEVLEAVFDKSFRGSCRIPVRPEFKAVLGECVWVVQDKNRKLNREQLELTGSELIEAVHIYLKNGLKGLNAYVQALRFVGGEAYGIPDFEAYKTVG